jgi:hypothetical protein
MKSKYMYTTKNQNKSYSNNICQKESDPVAQQQRQQQQRRRSVSLLKQLLYILHMYNKKGQNLGPVSRSCCSLSSSRRHARRFKMKLFKEVKKQECYFHATLIGRQKKRDSNEI